MGVMECGRNGCKSIMCEHSILSDSRYICGDCLAELRKYATAQHRNIKRNKYEWQKFIMKFMETEAGSQDPESCTFEDALDLEHLHNDKTMDR